MYIKNKTSNIEFKVGAQAFLGDEAGLTNSIFISLL